MTRLVALYPQTWRDRYEDEFIALMEERPPDALDRVDIIRGALDARLNPRRDGAAEPNLDDPLPYNGPWSARTAGWITLVGGFLWLATIAIALNGPMVFDGGGTYRDGSAAWVPFFISMALLGIGVWAVAATLPRTARVARAAAMVAGLAGLLWMFVPWLLWASATVTVSVAILAAGAARSGRWRRLDTAFLITGVVVAWGLLVIGGPGALVSKYDAGPLSLLFLAPMWFATAHALLQPVRPIALPLDASRLV
ncbi:MAG: hypothetical protein ABI562_03445 [Chloroflexota bacterium]